MRFKNSNIMVVKSKSETQSKIIIAIVNVWWRRLVKNDKVSRMSLKDEIRDDEDHYLSFSRDDTTEMNSKEALINEW